MSVGMPANLKLHEFGSIVLEGFEHLAGKTGFVGVYHVGSSVEGKEWRDVDVLLILDEDTWKFVGMQEAGTATGFELDPVWRSLVLAYSALGHEMTGLPIDFQIQPQAWANKKFGGKHRSALGFVPWRIRPAPVVTPEASK